MISSLLDERRYSLSVALLKSNQGSDHFNGNWSVSG